MIARISGRVIQRNKDSLILDCGFGFCYEVMTAPTVLEALCSSPENDPVTLVTYHYMQIDQAKGIPVIIGFSNTIEREFFELLITVSGIGPRAALRALKEPISVIAKAIYDGDVSFLCSLPGIGRQRAKEIIAKLQSKVGKFALLQNDTVSPHKETETGNGIAEEALVVLEQLQYKRNEAERMIKNALARCPSVATLEELLNEVYRQRK